MIISEEQELAQLIVKGDVQSVVDVFSSRAFGWISKCGSLSPSEVEDVIESLELDDSDAAAIIIHTLQAALSDIDEHDRYSEDFGSEAEINERIIAFKKQLTIKDGYQWEYLYKLARVLDNHYDNFTMFVQKMLTDPREIEFIEMFKKTKRIDRPDFILKTTDFSFMSPLLDEAILSTLANMTRYGATNFSEQEDRDEAEKAFEAFEYFVAIRPLPVCFGTEIITQIIQMTARWRNEVLAKKVSAYFDKITPNVYTYTSLCGYYAQYNNREKLIETLKIAESYGADNYQFGWANTWKDDEEVQNLIPKSIFSYR